MGKSKSLEGQKLVSSTEVFVQREHGQKGKICFGWFFLGKRELHRTYIGMHRYAFPSFRFWRVDVCKTGKITVLSTEVHRDGNTVKMGKKIAHDCVGLTRYGYESSVNCTVATTPSRCSATKRHVTGGAGCFFGQKSEGTLGFVNKIPKSVGDTNMRVTGYPAISQKPKVHIHPLMYRYSVRIYHGYAYVRPE
jgi:hypothetical protein